MQMRSGGDAIHIKYTGKRHRVRLRWRAVESKNRETKIRQYCRRQWNRALDEFVWKRHTVDAFFFVVFFGFLLRLARKWLDRFSVSIDAFSDFVGNECWMIAHVFAKEEFAGGFFPGDKSSHIIAWTQKNKKMKAFLLQKWKKKENIFCLLESENSNAYSEYWTIFVCKLNTLACTTHMGARAHAYECAKHTQIGMEHLHSAKLIHWETYVRTSVAAFIHAHTLVSVSPARAGYVAVVQRPPQSVYTRRYTPCNIYRQQYIQIKQGNLFYTNFISFALHSTATVLCI